MLDHDYNNPDNYDFGDTAEKEQQIEMPFSFDGQGRLLAKVPEPTQTLPPGRPGAPGMDTEANPLPTRPSSKQRRRKAYNAYRKEVRGLDKARNAMSRAHDRHKAALKRLISTTGGKHFIIRRKGTRLLCKAHRFGVTEEPI